MELIAASFAAVVTILAALIGGWFATRIHALEERVDELEEEQQTLWARERQLIDFIYRNGLQPPPPLEGNPS